MLAQAHEVSTHGSDVTMVTRLDQHELARFLDSVNSDSKTTIIAFDAAFDKESPLVKTLDNKGIKNLVVVKPAQEECDIDTVSIVDTINATLLTKLETKTIFVHVNAEIEYTDVEARALIQALVDLKKLCDEKGVVFGIRHEGAVVLGNVSGKSSAHCTDFAAALKALAYTNSKERYDFLYDVVCDYLDSVFVSTNCCDFIDDKCIGNRQQTVARRTMGCCWSFKYTQGGMAVDHRLCQLLAEDYTCTTKCMACKLFTCDSVKKKGIKFNPEEIPLLSVFFNKKQQRVLQKNFFMKKDLIIAKVIQEEKSVLPYFLFRLMNKEYIPTY